MITWTVLGFCTTAVSGSLVIYLHGHRYLRENNDSSPVQTTDSRYNKSGIEWEKRKSYFNPVSSLFSLALSPKWNETFSFNIQVPELALIRFCVEDEVSVVNKEFLGQYTLPVTSLNTGNTFIWTPCNSSKKSATFQPFIVTEALRESTASCLISRGQLCN